MIGKRSGRFLPLLIALALLFLVYPVMVELDRVRFLRIFFALVLLSSVYSLSGKKKTAFIASVLGLPALLTQAWALAVPGRSAMLIATILGLFFIGYVTAVVLKSVLSADRVSGDTIAGAISAYLLLGLIWAMLYGIVAVLDPSAFVVPGHVNFEEQLALGSEYLLIYYSFVTLTTLGYGEIHPTGTLGQTLAWMEAVTGQLYVAVLIARLVALHVAHGGKTGD